MKTVPPPPPQLCHSLFYSLLSIEECAELEALLVAKRRKLLLEEKLVPLPLFLPPIQIDYTETE